MSTCPVYIPGNMNMDCTELSLGKEATAAANVLNSPAEFVPALTTMAPAGGDVRVTPSTAS